VTPTIRLTRGDVDAVISPGRGGSLHSLRVAGRDILRDTLGDTPPDPRGPLETACFPLVPYANRIAHGRFRYDGGDYTVPLNFGDHPHSLHGFGWTAGWTVAKAGEDRVLLVHEGDRSWPSAYRAEQRISLLENGIELVLRIENLADRPMPAGLGFHPYFAREPGTRLRFKAQGVWLTGDDLLPERIAPAAALGDWDKGSPLTGDTLIDNCYAGWDGEAEVTREDGSFIRVTASGAPFLHLYRPPELPIFCLEPVTHMPNALNRPEGMASLGPGQALHLAMTITAG
jgi:aldose 1-epimerase